MKTLLLAGAMALGMTTLAHAQDMSTTDDQQEDMQMAAPDATPPDQSMDQTEPEQTAPDMAEPETAPDMTGPDTGETPPPPSTGDMTTPPSGETMPSQDMSTSAGMSGGMDVDANFAKYDKDSNGMLSPLEFGEMMAAMHAGVQGSASAAEKDRTSKKSNNAATNLINESAAELARVDTNHDWMVSREEAMAWGGASSSPM